MDKEKAKKAINKKTVARIGMDAVEVLPPSGAASDVLPDSHGAAINNAIFEFLSYEIPGGADSIKGINQLQFKALCIYIGRKVNSSVVRAPWVDSIGKGSFAPIDNNVLYSLFDIWAYMCAVGGFVPFIDDFFLFCGLSVDLVYSSSFKSSPARVEFYNKIRVFQESALAARLTEGRGNPTGCLAVLNHVHGWRSDASGAASLQVAAASAAALPDLSGDLVQIDQ